MHQFRSALARMLGISRSNRLDEDLRAELEAHLEMEMAEYIRRGMAPEDARRKAMLSAGGMTQAAEAVRDQRTLPWVEGVISDLKYAFRSLRLSPGFAMVAIVTLALGIGANTAIFSVVRGVLLKPLPHRDGDRLVYLRQSMDGPGGANLAFSVPEVRDLRDGAKSLAGLAEYSSWTGTLEDPGEATRIPIGLVTGNFFDVMGLSPILGRVTNPSDDGASAAPVMVLTHGFWVKRFGADSSIVGKQVRLDGRAVTVIGVIQPAPYFPDRVEAMLNMVISSHHLSASMVQGRTHRMTEVIARLAPGATVDDFRREASAVYSRITREYPEVYNAKQNYRLAVVPFKTAIGEEARLTLGLLMAAAVFVMLISTANVVNLTLMRGVRREHELVVRAALGAGVGRLRRLLLVENLMLTIAGAAAGAVLALAGVRLLVAFAERYSPRASEVRLDGMVLGFTLLLSVLVALVLSFAAYLPREGTLASLISAGMRRMSGSVRKNRLQRTLVVAQIAVSVVLLAGAGLLTRTMLRLADVDTGLSTEQVVTMEVPVLTASAAASGAAFNPAVFAAVRQKYDQMQREIRALPGVVDVGVGAPMPLRATSVRFEIKAEGKSLPPGEPNPRAEFRVADAKYFSAAGIPFVAGAPYVPGAKDRPIVINQVLAEKYFPNENPIGKRIAFTGEILKFTPISADWRTVVGVIRNTQDGGPEAKPRPVTYSPFEQELPFSGGLVVRADGNTAALIQEAQRIIRRIAPTTPIERVMTIEQYKDQTIAPRRLNAVLISSFGLLAVLIAAVGIAGVLAFSVSARTTEIGIRMSLGANQGQVQRMVLHEGGVLVVVGLIIGIAGAWFSSRFIQGLLFGVTPHDPATMASVALVMMMIGLTACWIPARRASRVDPAITVRS